MDIVATAVRTGMVVLRFQDHRICKGITQDFHPEKAAFHIHEGGDASRPAVKVLVGDLKAVFFVKTFDGDKTHNPPEDISGLAGQGRRVEVTFRDGEVLRGFTLGYNPAKPGFFVVPADPGGNNQRVFVVNAAVKKIAWR